MRRGIAPVLVALALAAGACSGADADAVAATTTTTTTTPAGPTTSDGAAPAGADGSGEAAGWEQVRAPATCRCSDGSPYHYFVKRADPTRVVFHLEGGGACFSADTCGPESPTFTRTLANGASPGETGIFDADEAGNPFAGWSMVYVPYCSGDLHLGDALQDYGSGVVVEHRGAVNASTALAAMATAFPDAEEVVVTGSSAGSASAPLYGGMAHDLLPDARITVVADASGAYPGDEVITTAIGTLWGAFENLPAWPSSAGLPDAAWSLPGLFVRADEHAPDITMATLNDAYDGVQATFMALIGQPGDLREAIVANEALIESEGVDVHSWLGPGTDHTILGRPELYDEEVAGVALVEWLADLVAGEQVDDVACTDCR